MRKCYRYLGFVHWSRDCNGVDRTGVCRVCGKEGHLGKECVDMSHCVLCVEAKKGDANHIAGSTKCGTYRDEMARLKRNALLTNKSR